MNSGKATTKGNNMIRKTLAIAVLMGFTPVYGDATPEQLKYMSASELASYNSMLAKRNETKKRVDDLTRKSARPSAISGARRTQRLTQEAIDSLAAKAGERAKRYEAMKIEDAQKAAEQEIAKKENATIIAELERREKQDREIQAKREAGERRDRLTALNSSPGEKLQGVNMQVRQSDVESFSERAGATGGVTFYYVNPADLGIVMPEALGKFNARLCLGFNSTSKELVAVEYRCDADFYEELELLLSAKYRLEPVGVGEMKATDGPRLIYLARTWELLNANYAWLRYTDRKRYERARQGEAAGL